jgi:hypothetical protein
MAQNITSIIELLASQEQGLTPDAGPNKKTRQVT